MSLASTILMVRPAAFGHNHQTAVDNFFQSNVPLHIDGMQEKVLAEFDSMAQQLVEHDIEVIAIEDTAEPPKPDAIFPNNWFCTFPSGVLSVFPMCAPNRRTEKRDEILHWIVENYETSGFEDWSEYEAEGQFLEGTGSMVMDHKNRLIYACVSDRTNLSLLKKFAPAHGYLAVPFRAEVKNGKPVYHTNVMMCIGDSFAVVCMEAIPDETERIAVNQLLETTGHRVITISPGQMHAFAGNMLQLKNLNGKKFLVMSSTAWNSLRLEQRNALRAFAEPIVVAVPTIEQEGGSVRCMMAEIFLRPKSN